MVLHTTTATEPKTSFKAHCFILLLVYMLLYLLFSGVLSIPDFNLKIEWFHSTNLSIVM